MYATFVSLRKMIEPDCLGDMLLDVFKVDDLDNIRLANWVVSHIHFARKCHFKMLKCTLQTKKKSA